MNTTTASKPKARTIRARNSRKERARKRKRIARFRALWWTLGAVIAVALMQQFNLINPVGVIAVLGVIEIVAKTWERLGRTISGQ